MEFNPKSPPQKPIKLKEIEKETDSSKITFEWKAPEVNGGSEIINYHIEYHQKGQKVQSIDTKNTETKYTITNGIEASKTYIVKVSAENKVATSFPSDEIEIIAAKCPDAPSDL